MVQAVEMVVTVRGESVANIASAMAAWLRENGFGGSERSETAGSGASDQVHHNWERFIASRDPDAKKLYAAFEEVGDQEVTLAELEKLAGISPLGAKLGGQTLSAKASLGEPAFILVRPNVYRRNRAVWPDAAA
jgi:hypothetical protein